MSPPPNYEFQEWWSKQQSSSSSSSSEDPDRPSPTWATLDIGSPPSASPASATTDKSSRSRNARQLRNLLCLRLYSSLSALSHLLSFSLSLAAAASRRLASARPDRWSDTTRLYRVTKAIAFLALLLLSVESLAFYNGWHLRAPSSEDFSGLLHLAYAAWLSLRADYIAPPLQLLADVCIVLFLIQSVDRLVLVLGCFWIKFRGIRPLAKEELGAGRGDVEAGVEYPMVLLQIPMCNERELLWVVLQAQNLRLLPPFGDLTFSCFWYYAQRKMLDANWRCGRQRWRSLLMVSGKMTLPHLLQRVGKNANAPLRIVFPRGVQQMDFELSPVYQQSIAAACIQDWPREKMLVQVLDDSDDVDVQRLLKAEVQKWQQKGVRILYRHRLIRTGYKAGNLKSAMSCDYVKDFEFVAIFDADFQPGTDFLKKTIPHFKGNDDVALVQSRWGFVNKDENLLTRLQNISLSFHFEVEQQVNGIFINFFGFNGTAGVWRIKALEESGGWMERTTVEDMDIAVRAHLGGWKFIYLNDVKCLCELPESYEAYKKQQHRWHSGPMQLFRLCFIDILRSKVWTEVDFYYPEIRILEFLTAVRIGCFWQKGQCGQKVALMRFVDLEQNGSLI
ncbi:hypothetical protein ACLOJK_008172 [Asimina triloba]